MNSLRTQFILSHILPLLIVVPLATIGLLYVVETQFLLTELSDRLMERASMVSEVLKSQPGVWTDPDRAQVFITGMGFQVGGELYLLQPDGVLIASYGVEANTTKDITYNELEGLDSAMQGQSSQIINYNWLAPDAEVIVPVLDARQELIGIVAVSQSLQGIESRLSQLRQYILMIIAIELIVGCLAGYFLARRLERPITTAAQDVIQISKGQEIQQEPLKGPEEIRQLFNALNTLSERLRILEETRRRSLANIVHELGRPLGAIQSAVHVLLNGIDQQPEVRQELLTGIDGEIKRMRPLLDDLALLHGQVTGSITLEIEEIDLNEWLPPLLSPWRATAQEKGQEFDSSIPEYLPAILIDPERMAQAIGNLLSNAIKYTPWDGRITVTAGADSNQCWIQISDTGPGILTEEQEHIFEPFFRSQHLQRFPQGLGLGLTIARDIVTAHGGHLDLYSQPGQGSQFTIYLPSLARG